MKHHPSRAQSIFVIDFKKFTTLNAVYEAFGGIMALLFWVYLSGCIFIFGARLCAAQAEVRSSPAKQLWRADEERVQLLK